MNTKVFNNFDQIINLTGYRPPDYLLNDRNRKSAEQVRQLQISSWLKTSSLKGHQFENQVQPDLSHYESLNYQISSFEALEAFYKLELRQTYYKTIKKSIESKTKEAQEKSDRKIKNIRDALKTKSQGTSQLFVCIVSAINYFRNSAEAVNSNGSVVLNELINELKTFSSINDFEKVYGVQLLLQELMQLISDSFPRMSEKAQETIVEQLVVLVREANIPALNIPLLSFLQKFRIGCSANKLITLVNPTEVKMHYQHVISDTNWVWMNGHLSYSSNGSHLKLLDLSNESSISSILEIQHPSSGFTWDAGFIKNNVLHVFCYFKDQKKLEIIRLTIDNLEVIDSKTLDLAIEISYIILNPDCFFISQNAGVKTLHSLKLDDVELRIEEVGEVSHWLLSQQHVLYSNKSNLVSIVEKNILYSASLEKLTFKKVAQEQNEFESYFIPNVNFVIGIKKSNFTITKLLNSYQPEHAEVLNITDSEFSESFFYFSEPQNSPFPSLFIDEEPSFLKATNYYETFNFFLGQLARRAVLFGNFISRDNFSSQDCREFSYFVNDGIASNFSDLLSNKELTESQLYLILFLIKTTYQNNHTLNISKFNKQMSKGFHELIYDIGRFASNCKHKSIEKLIIKLAYLTEESLIIEQVHEKFDCSAIAIESTLDKAKHGLKFSISEVRNLITSYSKHSIESIKTNLDNPNKINESAFQEDYLLDSIVATVASKECSNNDAFEILFDPIESISQVLELIIKNKGEEYVANSVLSTALKSTFIYKFGILSVVLLPMFCDLNNQSKINRIKSVLSHFITLKVFDDQNEQKINEVYHYYGQDQEYKIEKVLDENQKTSVYFSVISKNLHSSSFEFDDDLKRVDGKNLKLEANKKLNIKLKPETETTVWVSDLENKVESQSNVFNEFRFNIYASLLSEIENQLHPVHHKDKEGKEELNNLISSSLFMRVRLPEIPSTNLEKNDSYGFKKLNSTEDIDDFISFVSDYSNEEVIALFEYFNNLLGKRQLGLARTGKDIQEVVNNLFLVFVKRDNLVLRLKEYVDNFKQYSSEQTENALTTLFASAFAVLSKIKIWYSERKKIVVNNLGGQATSEQQDAAVEKERQSLIERSRFLLEVTWSTGHSQTINSKFKIQKEKFDAYLNDITIVFQSVNVTTADLLKELREKNIIIKRKEMAIRLLGEMFTSDFKGNFIDETLVFIINKVKRNSFLYTVFDDIDGADFRIEDSIRQNFHLLLAQIWNVYLSSSESSISRRCLALASLFWKIKSKEISLIDSLGIVAKFVHDLEKLLEDDSIEIDNRTDFTIAWCQKDSLAKLIFEAIILFTSQIFLKLKSVEESKSAPRTGMLSRQVSSLAEHEFEKVILSTVDSLVNLAKVVPKLRFRLLQHLIECLNVSSNILSSALPNYPNIISEILILAVNDEDIEIKLLASKLLNNLLLSFDFDFDEILMILESKANSVINDFIKKADGDSKRKFLTMYIYYIFDVISQKHSLPEKDENYSINLFVSFIRSCYRKEEFVDDVKQIFASHEENEFKNLCLLVQYGEYQTLKTGNFCLFNSTSTWNLFERNHDKFILLGFTESSDKEQLRIPISNNFDQYAVILPYVNLSTPNIFDDIVLKPTHQVCMVPGLKDKNIVLTGKEFIEKSLQNYKTMPIELKLKTLKMLETILETEELSQVNLGIEVISQLAEDYENIKEYQIVSRDIIENEFLVNRIIWEFSKQEAIIKDNSIMVLNHSCQYLKSPIYTIDESLNNFQRFEITGASNNKQIEVTCSDGVTKGYITENANLDQPKILVSSETFSRIEIHLDDLKIFPRSTCVFEVEDKEKVENDSELAIFFSNAEKSIKDFAINKSLLLNSLLKLTLNRCLILFYLQSEVARSTISLETKLNLFVHLNVEYESFTTQFKVSSNTHINLIEKAISEMSKEQELKNKIVALFFQFDTDASNMATSSLSVNYLTKLNKIILSNKTFLCGLSPESLMSIVSLFISKLDINEMVQDVVPLVKQALDSLLENITKESADLKNWLELVEKNTVKDMADLCLNQLTSFESKSSNNMEIVVQIFNRLADMCFMLKLRVPAYDYTPIGSSPYIKYFNQAILLKTEYKSEVDIEKYLHVMLEDNQIPIKQSKETVKYRFAPTDSSKLHLKKIDLKKDENDIARLSIKTSHLKGNEVILLFADEKAENLIDFIVNNDYSREIVINVNETPEVWMSMPFSRMQLQSWAQGENDGSLGIPEDNYAYRFKKSAGLDEYYPRSVIVGYNHSMIHTIDDKVLTSGTSYGNAQENDSMLRMFKEPAKVKAITEKVKSCWCNNYNSSVFLTPEGKIYGTGYNDSYILGEGSWSELREIDTSMIKGKIVKVAIGYSNSFVLTILGTVYMKGYASYNLIPNPENSSYVYEYRQINLPSGYKCVDLYGGEYSAIFILENGAKERFLFGIGDYSYGRNGLKENPLKPMKCTNVEEIEFSKLFARNYQCLAISRRGELYRFGQNNSSCFGKVKNNAYEVNAPEKYEFEGKYICDEIAISSNRSAVIARKGNKKVILVTGDRVYAEGEEDFYTIDDYKELNYFEKLGLIPLRVGISRYCTLVLALPTTRDWEVASIDAQATESEQGFEVEVSFYNDCKPSKEYIQEYKEKTTSLLSIIDKNLLQILNAILDKNESKELFKDQIKEFFKGKETPKSLAGLDEDSLKRLSKLLKKKGETVEEVLGYSFTVNENLLKDALDCVSDKIKKKIFTDKLSSILKGTEDYCDVNINRIKALNFHKKRIFDDTKDRTIFFQTYNVLKAKNINYCVYSNTRIYRVYLEGEGATDYGGPYREMLSLMAEELTMPCLNAFVKSPNNLNNSGSYRDRYVINPEAKPETHKDLFIFVGKLFGYSICSGYNLEISLHPCIWRLLAGSKLEEKDIELIDCYFYNSLIQLRNPEISDQEIGIITNNEWKVSNSRGTRVRISQSTDMITKENVDDYINAAIDFKLNEFKLQVDWIREGLKCFIK